MTISNVDGLVIVTMATVRIFFNEYHIHQNITIGSILFNFTTFHFERSFTISVRQIRRQVYFVLNYDALKIRFEKLY